MAAHAVATNELGVHATLTPSTVDTVTFTSRDLDQVEVLNRNGVDALYFTVDGSTPTVAGKNTQVIPAAMGAVQVTVPSSGATVVKLISAGAVAFSVVKVGTTFTEVGS